MASKPKPKANATSKTAAEMLETFKTDMGEKIGNFGGSVVDVVRIPFGIFELDLATGGGIPKGANTQIYGIESSGKTNLCYMLVANHQRMWPDEICAMVDLEHGFDPKWAKKFGVNTDKLIVLRPEYAEQAIDMIESLMYAEDIGLIIMDSIAALVTTQELESSAEKANVGTTGLAMGKLVRKTTTAFTVAEKSDRYPTLVYINQTRQKIGVMYGSPETTSGGNAHKFQASMIIAVYGSNVVDDKVSKVLPIAKHIRFQIKKWKVPIYSQGGEIDVAMIPHKGLRVGQSDDFSVIKEFLEERGEWEKTKKGYRMLDVEYPTMKEARAAITNTPLGYELREALINDLLKEALQDPLEDAEGESDMSDAI